MNKISGDFVKVGLPEEGQQEGACIRAVPTDTPAKPPKPPKRKSATRPVNGPKPNRFDALSNLIGKPAATKLVEQFGGRRINVPSQMPPRHKLVQTIGAAKARLLARTYGGTWLVVPVGPATFQKKRQEKALQLLASGTITKDVARLTGLSERTVQRLKAKMKQNKDC